MSSCWLVMPFSSLDISPRYSIVIITTVYDGIDSSCGLDTWSALLANLFVSRICVAGLCFCFFALVLFFPFPSDQIGGGFLVYYFFSSLSLLLFVFFWM